MKTKIRTVKTTFLDLDDLDVKLELEGAPEQGLGVKVLTGPEKIVVGYLNNDPGCENPLEDCDGMGKIYSLNSRHINSISMDELERYIEDDPFAVTLSYFEHGQCAWSVSGDKPRGTEGDWQWDGVDLAGIWIPDDCCRDHILSSGLAGLLPDDLKVEYTGTTSATTHSEITIKYPDGTIEKPFKSFKLAYEHAAQKLGIVVSEEALKKGQYAIALKCAGQACKEFTSWANGDCYCWTVETFDDEGTFVSRDNCCGFIGYEYAEQTLEEEMQSALK